MGTGVNVDSAHGAGRNLDRPERLAGALLAVATLFAASATFTAADPVTADALGIGLVWTACNPLWLVAVVVPLIHRAWSLSMSVWWVTSLPAALLIGWLLGHVTPAWMGGVVTGLIVFGVMATVLSSPDRD
ncbi:hypothetical protein [Gordonia sp. MP11Mi]|uniref:Uncharacterized protein n=1 Tax=Gordonia sp. MP11Mi TaxID=3022769 RepID=A0AA97CZI9_9ACTN